MRAFADRFFAWCGPTSLTFIGTVVLGYLPSLWNGAIAPTHGRGAWCLAFGFVYALLGIVDYSVMRLRESARSRLIYFSLQAGLLVGIFSTSRVSDEIYLCVFPLVAATVMIFPPVSATFMVGVLYALTIALERYFHGSSSLIPFAMAMLPAFVFVALCTRVAAREKAARTRAESLSAEIDKLAVIRERNRLAREIHDGLGHFLTAIHVQLEGALAVHPTSPERTLEAVAKAKGLARDALVEVRRSVETLQVDAVLASLSARLRDLVSATDGWGVSVSLQIVGEARTLTPAAEHSLFRAAQEGLTNVRKHARARTVVVTLDFRDSTRVLVRVTDDGAGRLAGPTGQGGQGLAGVRERIDALGGRVVAANQSGGGFCLQVEIPA